MVTTTLNISALQFFSTENFFKNSVSVKPMNFKPLKCARFLLWIFLFVNLAAFYAVYKHTLTCRLYRRCRLLKN